MTNPLIRRLRIIGDLFAHTQVTTNNAKDAYDLEPITNVAGGFAVLDENGHLLVEQVPSQQPQAHAASHILGGTDELELDASQITSGSIPPEVIEESGITADLDLKEDKANKGIANGYASLDETKRLSIDELPEFLEDLYLQTIDPTYAQEVLLNTKRGMR